MKYRKRGLFDGTCTKCGTELTPVNWSEGRRTRRDYRCTGCCTAYSHSYRKSSPQKYLWSAAKKRSGDKGLAFDIEPSDIIIPDRCPVLGIPMVFSTGGRAPGSPSLDRIDPSQGYVRGNIEVISWRANDLKKDATPDELMRLAQYVQPRPC